MTAIGMMFIVTWDGDAIDPMTKARLGEEPPPR